MPRKSQPVLPLRASPDGGLLQGLFCGPGTTEENRQKMSVTDPAAGSQTGLEGTGFSRYMKPENRAGFGPRGKASPNNGRGGTA
jgi:hypothetical protein